MERGVSAQKETDFEVEGVIGIKPHPRKSESYLYLVTFKGYAHSVLGTTFCFNHLKKMRHTTHK
jgi:hypothetical protein